jgi:UDP-N-acetylmuramoyl-tripeptide--D-alanyl-D-alanine ligase
MTMATLAQVLALLPDGRLVGGDAAADTAFDRVHTDTRTLRAGDLFVALRGERFDANDFLPQAAAAGAAAALAERGLPAGDLHLPGVHLPGVLVPDALAALQQLAAGWRAGWEGPLIAVTGSNGKTTVTQMVASILRAWLGDAALSTAGNFNNHIGVPLTLLRLRPHHRAAVLELGMNHPGEIALLADLAQPTVALVNNAQREHQEFMDGVDAVARENGSVIEALDADGTAVLPLADACLPLWRSLAGARRAWTFSAAASLDAAAAADPMTHVAAVARPDPEGTGWLLQLYTPCGGADTTLALAGWHNVANAAAAAACALAAGAPLAAVALGLAAFKPVAGRTQTLHLQRGDRQVTLVDDSYNANPDSVLAAIDVLASLPGPRWLVLGDMGEVGAQGPQFHAEVGRRARERGIDCVWAVGPLATHVGAHRCFASTAHAVAALAEGPAAASVLVKGSRFMQMEQVVAALVQGAGPCC